MPTLIGAAVLAIGGVVLMRVFRREWDRVNKSMDSERAERMAAQAKQAPTLERDPQTGAYRPKMD